jgi:tetraacyldisaccharide 4'-kinase
MSFAERHWYRLSAVSVILLPLSLIFLAVVSLRRALYRTGVLSSVRLAVPVIVVGNLTVGGTGKTPLVLWIVRELLSWGRKPGIVCRGYSGAAKATRAVDGRDDAALVGDEPLLLARRAGCPVWIGVDRPQAGEALLAAHPGCDVIVCDDGLQHYRLQRDVELAVEDERGAGNGFLLPAGPLREPRTRRVDAYVVNAEDFTHGPAPSGERSAIGNRARITGMRLVPGDFYRVTDPALGVSRTELVGKRLHAVAGIGNPRRFFQTLERMGLVAVPHAFPDHHRFSSEDLTFDDCDYVLMTEKDAVKCRGFGRDDLVALRVDAEVDPALAEIIRNKIHGPAPA